MLTEFDDYLCHQTVDALEYPYTSDPRFYSRHFITFYSKTGEIAGITGMGCYPNSGVMDGFALAAFEGKTQRNLRVSRKLEHDPHLTTVGPVKIEILDPLRKFRIVCEGSFLGFGYDIVCDAITTPFERTPRYLARVNGRVSHRTCHFNQGYTCKGTFTVDGRTHAVTPDSWFGVRDVSWGIRHNWEPSTSGPTGPGQGPGPGHYGQGDHPVGGYHQPHNSWVPFVSGGDTCYLCFTFYPPAYMVGGALLYPWDDPRPGLKLVGIERKNVVMDERAKRFESCTLVFTDERGEQIDLHVRRICTVYEAGGGYLDVGTGYQMGKPMGKLHVEGETWDLAGQPLPVPNNRSVAAHFSEMRWGDRTAYGLFEVIDEGLWKQRYARFTPPTVVTRAGD